jgi:DtxR family Mn-dependent transcriptional regulator
MHSSSVEDYLKAIFKLSQPDGMVRTGRLAVQLGITAGSVTEMVKRMAGLSPPLVIHHQHHGISLTDHGRREALEVIRRHRLLETFLNQVLGLGWEAVHEEAEILEHHLSERMVEAIDRHLGSPCVDPHGEPIPDATGRLSTPPGRCLSEWTPGRPFRVVRVDPSMGDILGYLNQLHIELGTTGTLVDRAPFDGPVTLRLDRGASPSEAAISRTVAGRIFVSDP